MSDISQTLMYVPYIYRSNNVYSILQNMVASVSDVVTFQKFFYCNRNLTFGALSFPYLHHPLIFQRKDIVECLLKNNVPVNRCDYLDYCIRNIDDPTFVKLLIKYNATVTENHRNFLINKLKITQGENNQKRKNDLTKLQYLNLSK
jgi:hypothetical protein